MTHRLPLSAGQLDIWFDEKLSGFRVNGNLTSRLVIEDGCYCRAARTGAGGVCHTDATLPERNFNLPSIQYPYEFHVRTVWESRIPFQRRTNSFDVFIMQCIDEKGAVRITG